MPSPTSAHSSALPRAAEWVETKHLLHLRRKPSWPQRKSINTVYVFTQPQTFLAFGASGQQGQFAFGAWRLSLAEAMAKAQGLKDDQADPASVFVYRGEPRHIAEQLGVDCSPVAGPVIPIIYHLNLRDPAGYFLATKFEMRNKDVIFASNAQTVETTKLMAYLRQITATVNDPLMAAVNAYTIKNLASGAAATTAIVTGAVGP